VISVARYCTRRVLDAPNRLSEVRTLAHQAMLGRRMLQLLQLADYWLPQALRLVAELEIADHLSETEPTSLASLAAVTDTDPDALMRFMRALASEGVFEELPGGRFRLSKRGALLRSDHPWSLASILRMPAVLWDAWGDGAYSLRTGRPAFNQRFGKGFFEYLAEHEDANRRLNRAMQDRIRPLAAGVLPMIRWGNDATVVDVGGGTGGFLSLILDVNPKLRGVLFEQPHVIAQASNVLMEAGVSDRCTLVEGDFFRDVPAGGDTYIFTNVLHNWGDEDATRILTNCRHAMKPGKRVLIIETVVPADGRRHPAKIFDLEMLVVWGGRERTESEYHSLLSRSGFSLRHVTPTFSPLSLVEATAV
jgi:ubiquinone/menaquinone biosynthesis C-methylase UbiE